MSVSVALRRLGTDGHGQPRTGMDGGSHPGLDRLRLVADSECVRDAKGRCKALMPRGLFGFVRFRPVSFGFHRGIPTTEVGAG